VSSVYSINVLKLEETHVTALNFFFTNLDTMFVDILLRDLAHDFCIDFLELRPLRFRNQFMRGQKTIRSHLKLFSYLLYMLD